MAEWIVEAETLETLENGFYTIGNNGEPIVRCKECKHRPTGSGVNHDVIFPDRDYRCPCRCEDFWYSWIPDDDWFCGNGERKDGGEE